ncbi:hypothetical protein HPP92_018724 [Vanilla planifolia]|uniref:FLZ-type domain-containing protein n=1 Tax=Vanilla planifolia TaxID=51239 RepID=A0A835QEL5_VANPL|nr:hypothetical protein HPP92_019314 [Vanilla planifolia]KAG0469396.1 hypothetical protein HPP92_018724 [Vanilla planifolia]
MSSFSHFSFSSSRVPFRTARLPATFYRQGDCGSIEWQLQVEIGGGKARRSLMRRTTSLSVLPPDLLGPLVTHPMVRSPTRQLEGREGSMLPPVPERRCVRRRHSVDISEKDASHFLNACGLCKRNLGPGCDTFMYRGEVAFCSHACREQQIMEDKRKEKTKRLLMSMQKENCRRSIDQTFPTPPQAKPLHHP